MCTYVSLAPAWNYNGQAAADAEYLASEAARKLKEAAIKLAIVSWLSWQAPGPFYPCKKRFAVSLS